MDDHKQFFDAQQKKNSLLDRACSDLNNRIKTTDRYIDQFLPFRMIKEVGSFMEFLLPEE